MKNDILAGQAGIEEVQRLLDAGLAVMHRYGTSRSPRVADIVAEADLSNDAFYRHFAGKDELVAAILDAGTARLLGYLAHQMGKVDDPAEKVRRWIEGIMAQTFMPAVAEATRAILWNAARVSDDTRRRGSARRPLAELLEGPVAQLGSTDPARDALLISYACMTRMDEFLWAREAPSADDMEHLVAFSLRAAGDRG
ncbi:MAG: TetR/AcrR family transcriptional regulator [Acidimicrobiales bacterium]